MLIYAINQQSVVLPTDGHSAYPPAIAQLKAEGALAEDWPKVLLAAKTYGSVFYDKSPPSIARGKW